MFATILVGLVSVIDCCFDTDKDFVTEFSLSLWTVLFWLVAAGTVILLFVITGVAEETPCFSGGTACHFRFGLFVVLLFSKAVAVALEDDEDNNPFFFVPKPDALAGRSPNNVLLLLLLLLLVLPVKKEKLDHP